MRDRVIAHFWLSLVTFVVLCIVGWHMIAVGFLGAAATCGMLWFFDSL